MAIGARRGIGKQVREDDRPLAALLALGGFRRNPTPVDKPTGKGYRR